MTKFSANLGFLWTDRTLPDAIRAAKAAGFDAVECHFPYDTPIAETNAALIETGLPMLGINTIKGETNGLAAMIGLEEEARTAIDQAISYGQQIGVRYIHVMAGTASGAAAHQCYLRNLRYAAENASIHGIDVLVEPLNPKDAPGYFLNSSEQAVAIIKELAIPNIKLMFDCYHIELIEGDIAGRLDAHLPMIGHIQFASVPDRSAPDSGTVDYAHIFRLLKQMGWSQPVGAEYHATPDTASSLGWMKKLGQS